MKSAVILFYFLFAIFTLSSCSPKSTYELKVVDGFTYEEFSSAAAGVVAIIDHNHSAAASPCTGAYIGGSFVLSAAHCIFPRGGFVYFGKNFRGDSADEARRQSRTLKRKLLHGHYPEYRFSLPRDLTETNQDVSVTNSDLAIFEFQGNPPPGAKALSLGQIHVVTDQTYMVGGFGFTHRQTPGSDGVQNFAPFQVQFVSSEYGVIVTKQENRTTSLGDSGSPLLDISSTTKVVGVLSSGDSSVGGTMTTFISTAKYNTWIRNGLAILKGERESESESEWYKLKEY